MNILLVDEDVAAVRALAALLTKSGHSAEVALDGRTAIQRLREKPFDALVTEWLLPDLDGTSIVREVRSRPGTPLVAILVSGLDGPLARSHAARVGADAFLAKPVAGASLLNSLAIGRAKRTDVSGAAVLPVLSTRAWRELPRSIAATLTECTGLRLEPRLPQPPAGDLPLRTSMLMVDVQHQIELEVLLYASTTSGRALAEVMLREPDADLPTMRELMKELCNNVLGSLKLAVAADGFEFTLSLVDRGEPRLPAEASRSFSALAAHSFAGAGVELLVAAGARPTPTSAVKSSGLRENMVLAENVLNEKGMLILPLGTRLTVSSAERVARHLPDRTVRVCGVAA